MATIDSYELLDFNDKVENNGTSGKGKLSASEFNELVDAVNQNTEWVVDVSNKVGNLVFTVVDSEEDYDALETKDSGTIYFVLEG